MWNNAVPLAAHAPATFLVFTVNAAARNVASAVGRVGNREQHIGRAQLVITSLLPDCWVC